MILVVSTLIVKQMQISFNISYLTDVYDESTHICGSTGKMVRFQYRIYDTPELPLGMVV